MEDLKGRVGNAIARRRESIGMEQKELARQVSERLGRKVTEDQISRWETGKNLVRLDALLEIAGVLKVSLEQLITGEESFFDSVVQEMDGRFGARIARIEKHLGL